MYANLRAHAAWGSDQALPRDPVLDHQVGAELIRRDERGSATIQMVVLLPALFAVIFIEMQAALYYHARSVVLSAAHKAARVAASENGRDVDGITNDETFIADAAGNDALPHAPITAGRTGTAITISVTVDIALAESRCSAAG